MNVIWTVALVAALAGPPNPAESTSALPVVHRDYAAALQAARQQRRRLLVVFHAREQPAETLGLDLTQWFRQPSIVDRLRADYVVAQLPCDYCLRGDPRRPILEHPSLVEMHQRPGIAIIDMMDPDGPHFGDVISVLPLDAGQPLMPEQLEVLLEMPVGSMTQRALLFAVLTHPDQPQSTRGSLHPVLVAATREHSRRQAALGLQGHHQWEWRFQELKAQLPGCSVYEVCAESWPGESLSEAAAECVRCWRQSPGHWAHVHSASRFYAFDMRRGANGVWYATGIVAR